MQLLTPSNLTCTRLEGMELYTGPFIPVERMIVEADPVRDASERSGDPVNIRAEEDSP